MKSRGPDIEATLSIPLEALDMIGDSIDDKTLRDVTRKAVDLICTKHEDIDYHVPSTVVHLMWTRCNKWRTADSVLQKPYIQFPITAQYKGSLTRPLTGK